VSSNNQVTIKASSIEKIIKELNEISILCPEPNLQAKIEGLQNYVSSIMNLRSKTSIEDVIYEKMVEVKHSNTDLHLKLYMLYRDLVCSRITKEDSIISFESLLSLFPTDMLIY